MAINKRTERRALLKLELKSAENDLKLNLQKVAEKLYDIPFESSAEETLDSNKWFETDNIFAQARQSYNGILQPFLEQPQVYKLAATKEIVRHIDKNYKPQALLDEYGQEEIKEEFIQSYIDPFALPKPWELKIIGNKTFYFNTETFERFDSQPQEIWEAKLGLLQKLTPRADFDGYEYKEDGVERRMRLRYQADFEHRLLEEIKRREKNPTDIEQVEDALFSIVDTVCKAEETYLRQEKKLELKKLRETYHLCAKDYRMKLMGANETEDGDIVRFVTDLEFLDCIITPAGLILPLFRPYDLLDKHEAEREVVRAIERERLRKEEVERNLPFKEKAKNLWDVAKRDPKLAGKQLFEGAKYNGKQLLKKIDREKIIAVSKKIIVGGVNGLLKITKEPKKYIEAAKEKFTKAIKSVLGADEDPDIDIDDIIEELAVEDAAKKEQEEEELQRKNRKVDTRPVRMVHPDAVIITLTIVVNPPPRYIKHLPKTWKDDVREKADEIKKKVLTELERVSILKPILRKLKKEKKKINPERLNQTSVSVQAEGEFSPKRKHKKRDHKSNGKNRVGDLNRGDGSNAPSVSEAEEAGWDSTKQRGEQEHVIPTATAAAANDDDPERTLGLEAVSALEPEPEPEPDVSKPKYKEEDTGWGDEGEEESVAKSRASGELGGSGVGGEDDNRTLNSEERAARIAAMMRGMSEPQVFDAMRFEVSLLTRDSSLIHFYLNWCLFCLEYFIREIIAYVLKCIV